jgi:hypothetical protein
VCVVRVRVRVRTDPESDLWEEEEEALLTVYNMWQQAGKHNAPSRAKLIS